MDLEVQGAKEALKEANRILVITGAGISAESGLPTYRGVSGLYNGGLTEDGVTIEEAISGEMLRTRPAITWKYLLQIEMGCRGADPSQAHRLLAELEKTKEVVILTQNIDHLHHKAGSTNIIDIHGDLYDIKCMSCGQGFRVESYARYEEVELPPPCEKCAGKLRPEVVLFGEMLDQMKLARFYEEQRKGFDLVMSIGTTSVFPYIAGPVVQAATMGRPTIEINPDQTQVSGYCRYRFAQGAGPTLQQLLD